MYRVPGELGAVRTSTRQLTDATVRIGFQWGDGHWSYVGRDVEGQGREERTMNLDPSDAIANGDYGIDVACHEIGHSLGLQLLFERDAPGNDVYLEADDDSGYATNAHIQRTLHAGRTYVLRLRLYWAAEMGATAVMW